ncbi:MAG: ATP-binding protein [Gaiellaceae bacterium]
MRPESRLPASERWIAWVRLGALVFAALEVGVFTQRFPAGYERWAWLITVIFAAGTALFFWLSRGDPLRWPREVGLAALAFDTAVIAAYAVVYSYEYGNPARWALIFAVLEGALRYEVRGGISVSVALIPVFGFEEWWRAEHFGPPGFLVVRATFPAATHLVTGLMIGWLVRCLDLEAGRARAEAAEAAELRDELGRRVDVLEAAARCARALGSSLDLEQAFGAFIRELRGLVPFERVAIVLVESDIAVVVAAAGRGTQTVFPTGSAASASGTVLDEVLKGRTVVRADMAEQLYAEEPEFVNLGLLSRLAAPLLVGARPIGMLSLLRERPDAFSAEEIELVTLLGRLVAGAVQNIRSYEGERQTVEELRRLSALRADFVSLVSHELRSPMAAVIGSARTLHQRWRQLSAEHRDAFLALIGDETQRLADLIADVLDTSRIEAGTFSFSFSDVDVTDLVNEVVATAALGQDEVPVFANVSGLLPVVRGDNERLRQVVTNLVDNAIKYSPAGKAVEVTARAEEASVQIAVRDAGPGIATENQKLIFEKFGRADVGGAAMPGTGLGLFIARSIAEAHGGSVEVSSRAGSGATFTLTLPAER